MDGEPDLAEEAGERRKLRVVEERAVRRHVDREPRLRAEAPDEVEESPEANGSPPPNATSSAPAAARRLHANVGAGLGVEGEHRAVERVFAEEHPPQYRRSADSAPRAHCLRRGAFTATRKHALSPLARHVDVPGS